MAFKLELGVVVLCHFPMLKQIPFTVQVSLCSPLSLPDFYTGPLLEGFRFVPLCSRTIPVGFEWRNNSLLVSSFDGINLIETTDSVKAICG